MRPLHPFAIFCMLAFSCGPVASADPIAFTSAQAAFCDSLAQPCPDYGVGGISFTAGVPASSSLSRSFIIDGFRNLGVQSSIIVDQGFFSGYAAAQGSAVGGGASNGVSANAYGEELDYLTIGSGALLDMPIHLTGAVDISYSEAGSAVFSAGTTFAFVSLHLNCIAGDPTTFATTNCSRNFDYTSSADVDAVFHLLIPFTAGQQFYFQLSPTLIASFGLPFIAPGSETALLSGHAVGDFSHTAIFGPASVLDASGNALSNVPIESLSGFDYRAGFIAAPGASPPGAAPEPATLALLLVGLIGVAALRAGRSNVFTTPE